MYGQTPAPQPYAPSLMHYALVFGVGMGLSMFARVPLAAGAALYTLGFWIRGRPMTQTMLQQGTMRVEQMRLAQYQAAAGQIPRASDDPIGAGVRHGVAVSPSSVINVRPDVIDANTY